MADATRQPRALVTGADGFVGRVLAARLKALGWDVRAATRATIGDIGPGTDWGAALSGIEVVAHLAARAHRLSRAGRDDLEAFRRVNRDGTRRLAEAAAAAGARRLVLVSSIGVMGRRTEPGHPFTEADPPAPQGAYAVSKWEAEEALRRIAADTGLDGVVVRPPLVHGPGAPGNVARLLAAVRRGVPLPLAGIRNRRSLVGVDNLCDLLARCLVEPAAAGGTFLVADGETVSTPELVRRLGVAAGTPARLVPFPPRLLEAALRALGRAEMADGLTGSLEVDASLAGRRLGWCPPVTLDEGLRRCAAGVVDNAR